MKVILLEQVRKLGTVGTVVNVKDGYARNFLIPSKKALRATDDNIIYFEEKRSEIESANTEKSKIAGKLAENINDIFVSVIRQAGEDGRLYGSVTAAIIAKAISEKSGKEVDRKQIILNSPIKYIGIYKVDVNLYADVVATVNVNISRTLGEAEESAKKFLKGEVIAKSKEDPESIFKEKEETISEEKASA